MSCSSPCSRHGSHPSAARRKLPPIEEENSRGNSRKEWSGWIFDGTMFRRWLTESPTQSSVTERLGGAWKINARAVLEETKMAFAESSMNAWWLCASVSWARNQTIGTSAFSPFQWILGRGLKLPADLLDSFGKLHVAMRMEEKTAFAARLRLISSAQRAVAAQRSSRGLSQAVSARSRNVATTSG